MARRAVQFTVVRPGGLTVDAPTGTINVIKGEVSVLCAMLVLVDACMA